MFSSRNIATALIAVAVTVTLHGGWLRALEMTPATPTVITA